jgi:hypothetical protein
MNPSPGPRYGTVAAVVGGLAVVACCLIAAVVLAVDVFRGGEPAVAATADTNAATRGWQVAEDVPVSFGFIAVEHAEAQKGISPKQVAGATHGIGSWVGLDKSLVQTSVTLTNTSGRPVRYRADQFKLMAKDANGLERPIDLEYASVQQGRLEPDAAVDVVLSYIAPRDGATLTTRFADPGRDTPVTIDLGLDAGRISKADQKLLGQQHTGTDPTVKSGK